MDYDRGQDIGMKDYFKEKYSIGEILKDSLPFGNQRNVGKGH